jgi:hypothetical protein
MRLPSRPHPHALWHAEQQRVEGLMPVTIHHINAAVRDGEHLQLSGHDIDKVPP